MRFLGLSTGKAEKALVGDWGRGRSTRPPLWGGEAWFPPPRLLQAQGGETSICLVTTRPRTLGQGLFSWEFVSTPGVGAVGGWDTD